MSRVRSEGDASRQYHANVESFSSDGILTHYVERAEVGLFPQEREAIDRYFTEPGARVLDVGCGTGRTTVRLAELGFDVTGVDVSEGMVERASALFPDLAFRVGDATDLDYGPDSFEYVLFSHNGLDYLHPEAQRLAALRELRRVLRPGGVLVFSSHNSWYRFPAAFLDPAFVRTFYLAEGNLARLFRRYKTDVLADGTLETYFSNPVRQRRQLRECGYEPLDVVGKRAGPSRLLEAMLYYVAEPATG